MVGHAILGGVVSANFLGTVATPHLLSATRVDLLLLLALLNVQQPRPEDRNRFRLVLELGALVLADRDDTGRDVGDADRGRVLLHVLATVASCVEDIYSQ